MAPGSPERGDRSADSFVFCSSVCIYVAGVCDLSPRSTINHVYFRARQVFEFGEAELLGESIYTGVFKEFFTAVVNARCSRIVFYTLFRAETTREVFAGILVLEETANRIERFML